MEGGVRVAAPEGLHQGRGDVVHGVAPLVVAHGAALGDLGGVLLGNEELPFFRLGGAAQKLHGVDGLPHIPAAGGGNLKGQPLLPRKRQGRALLLNVQRPEDGGLRLLRGDRLELEDRAPAEEGAVDIEIGVLRGRGDEGQLAILHELQEALLLLLIKILNLVQVQQHPAGGQQGPHIGDDVLDVLEGSGGGVEAVEGFMGPLRHDVGNGGFPGAGGTVEDHVGLGPSLNQAAEHRAGGQEVPLSDDFIQSFRADLIRQGALHGSPSFFRFMGRDYTTPEAKFPAASGKNLSSKRRKARPCQALPRHAEGARRLLSGSGSLAICAAARKHKSSRLNDGGARLFSVYCNPGEFPSVINSSPIRIPRVPL